MRTLNVMICLIFLLFAGWQYNDPDPYIWIPIYGFVALAYGLAAFGMEMPYKILVSGLILMTMYMLTYIPDLYRWIQMGEPSIVDTMQAERPWIELTREGFGLMLCVAFTGWRVRLARRHN